MNKEDWTSVGIKLLGLYFLVVSGASFVAQAIAIMANFRKESGIMWKGIVIWQGPITSCLMLIAALVMIAKSEMICARLWRK